MLMIKSDLKELSLELPKETVWLNAFILMIFSIDFNKKNKQKLFFSYYSLHNRTAI